MYEIDAFCNLECGAEGECLMERKGEDSVQKRCLCPHGKFGEKCSNGERVKHFPFSNKQSFVQNAKIDLPADKFISAPEFSGHSYIALPTLTNAYSDLQLSMEFRQVSIISFTLSILRNFADRSGEFWVCKLIAPVRPLGAIHRQVFTKPLSNSS